MATRFEPDRAGIAAFGRSQGMREALEKMLADKVKPRAEASTPVLSGRMKESWRTTSGVENGRAYGRIYNFAANPDNGYRYPNAIEFGNSRIKKQRVLGRALDALRD